MDKKKVTGVTQSKKKTHLVLSALLLGATCYLSLVYLLPWLATAPTYRTPRIDREPYRRASKYVIILRREEKEDGLDPSLPHRNSPLALYILEKDRLVKLHGDLTCRSTSTAKKEPLAEDAPTVARYLEIEKKDYPYGFESVPLGCYQLRMPSHTGERPDWMQISDWYDSNGITLERPQKLRYISKIDGQGSAIQYVKSGVIQERLRKSGTYLHPSITKFWSHRDSFGCINLCSQPPAGNTMDDWSVFLEWLSVDTLTSAETPVGLIVTDQENLLRGNGQFPEALHVQFRIEKGRVSCDLLL